MIRFFLLITLFIFTFQLKSNCQDTIYIYDVNSATVSLKLMPVFNINAVSDSLDPEYGIYGTTILPDSIPTDTSPNSKFSVLKNASSYYSNYNFPFTAVTLIRYGLSITGAIIGKNLLLVFAYDVYSRQNHAWRNLHDTNPFFQDGVIMNGYSQLHPLRYYILDPPESNDYCECFAVIEVAENIGDSSGYFGIALDTVTSDYDSLLIFNLSYPAEGFPTYYNSPVNGDTLGLKYGLIQNVNDSVFKSSYSGNGEYASPYFDNKYRIRGLTWSHGINYKIGAESFYFIKYVKDSLATVINEESDFDDFIIYPNPTNTTLNIKFNNQQVSNATISIINLLGVKTLTSNVSAGSSQLTFDVSQLAQGTYFINFVTKEKVISRKFIKL